MREDINRQPGEPVAAPIAAQSGEAVAQNYIARELREARKSLRITQILSAVMVLGSLAYLGYITMTLRSTLEPKNAAEIANGLISERVETQAQSLADQTKEKVPQLIAQLPDYAIEEMPKYRQALENQIDTDMRAHFAKASTLMEGHVDEFIVTHKADIADILKTGQDPAALRRLGVELEVEFHKYLKTASLDGKETAQQKLDKSLEALHQIEKKMVRLAANKNLTPQEKKLRRAIAIMSANINFQVEQNGLKMAKQPF